MPSVQSEVLLFLLPFPEPKDIIDRLQKKHPHFEIRYRNIPFRGQALYRNNQAAPDEVFADVTILCTLAAGLPSSPDKAPKLKFIHFISAGINHILKTPTYNDTDLTLTTSSGIHGPMISEWVILQILSNSHKQKKLLEWQKAHKWGKHEELGSLKDSVGMRLGVLGYGSIGRQAARVSHAMGMDVIAYTASPRTSPESKKDTGYIVPGTGDADGSIPIAWYSGTDKESLHEFLSKDIDILLVSVPLTKLTKHLLSAPEFEILGRKNAFLLNISRGGILNQPELLTFLQKSPAEGGLRGAALDVTDPEPLPEDDPAWDIENIIITPHISGLSEAYLDRALEVLDINITNLEAGRPLINVVDRKRGY